MLLYKLLTMRNNSSNGENRSSMSLLNFHSGKLFISLPNYILPGMKYFRGMKKSLN